MSNLFFVKVTDHLRKKESYYVNCNEIKSFSAIVLNNKKIVYYVEFMDSNRNSMCLHQIRKSDYERLKRL